MFFPSAIFFKHTILTICEKGWWSNCLLGIKTASLSEWKVINPCLHLCNVNESEVRHIVLWFKLWCNKRSVLISSQSRKAGVIDIQSITCWMYKTRFAWGWGAVSLKCFLFTSLEVFFRHIQLAGVTVNLIYPSNILKHPRNHPVKTPSFLVSVFVSKTSYLDILVLLIYISNIYTEQAERIDYVA